MRQLSVRGWDDDLERALRSLARREGISLNQAALRLLRKGAGLAPDKANANSIGSSLDHLIGTWSKKEADSFDKAIVDFDSADEFPVDVPAGL